MLYCFLHFTKTKNFVFYIFYSSYHKCLVTVLKYYWHLMQELSEKCYREDIKLFKGLDTSVHDSTDSNLHWVQLLFLSMI